MHKHYNLVYRIYSLAHERCDDATRQKAGEDIKIRMFDKEYHIVDEKCAIHYWNRELSTYSFELSSEFCDKKSQLPVGTRYLGWFINPDVKTEVYSLAYIRSDSQESVNKGKLYSFECMLIYKQEIKDYLSQIFDKDLVLVEKEFEDRIANGDILQNYNGKYAWVINDKVKLVKSAHLPEKPINVVIDKGVLSELSDLHCIIKYPDEDKFEFQRIK